MPQDILDALDAAVFNTWGEAVTVSGEPSRAIWQPDDADVPGTELARRSDRVLHLAFRESGAPHLSRGTRVVFRGAAYIVDGTPDVRDALTVVALLPAGGGRPWTASFGPAFG